MDDDRIAREQERRMLEMLEQSALKDYPNPERIGCPGSEFLKQLATNRHSIDLSEPALDHVPVCSPCFQEFVRYRDAARRARMTRRSLIAGGVAAGAAGIAVVGLLLSHAARPVSRPDDYAGGNLDLSKDTVTRGVESPDVVNRPKQVLARRKLDLTIRLPFGSEDGNYEVEVNRVNGEPVTPRTAGVARIVHGDTLLTVKLDLSNLRPDKYNLEIRRPPYDWNHYEVEIR
jgi:hypothetical protein